MTAHAKLSASGSARWLACPGSVNILDEYVADGAIRIGGSSPAAEEGTCAHELAATCLDKGHDPKQYLGQTLNDAPKVAVDQEMTRYVQDYMDYCNSLPGAAFIEERVEYTDWVPGGFGTSDYFTFDERNTTCHIVDLKYGRGVPVYAENNTQAMMYALGVYQEFGWMYRIERFEAHIYQPRINNISTWSFTLEELLEFGNVVKAAVAKIKSGSREQNPGEKQCKWCPLKAVCTALQTFTEETLLAEFDDISSTDDLPSPDKVDPKKILAAKPLIESWLTAVENRVRDQLDGGVKVDGFKLVAGRKTRKWNPDIEATLVEILGDKAYDAPKLLTPAKAEKIVGKEQLLEHINTTTGKPIMVPESDKRPACDADFFEAL